MKPEQLAIVLQQRELAAMRKTHGIVGLREVSVYEKHLVTKRAEVKPQVQLNGLSER